MQHERVEKNVGLMAILITVAISFGGLVEIVPLFFIKDTTEPVAGLEPWTPVQLEGRDIYIREGCYNCHTQMVRPLRAEVERYGPFSQAGESVYNFTFQWGSKRTGPDLARVGGRYSDEWHKAHLYDPRSVVPESNMPAFPWLFTNEVNSENTPNKLKALQTLGVPYTDEMIATAADQTRGVKEIDALVAYLQKLGTVVTGR
ncbi:cytochrome-c oxidase, cbb3-type subunit II [Reinekea marinisedimentorum]|uniref:Cytochrome c oxidase cbb3-type subunit 2 n=1 Tax=Reinekea marinisedimentorum TaxID=230495 RepID=A0A4R3I553_9GAMM|nr:cytochrome-c oxidase, cbb3-type subunit II [Reinekea marinisedimentorum]TCS40771.1 cytochrome c oxidase cbb3-type subunit 2 [Reinekea marinisedimentorum]